VLDAVPRPLTSAELLAGETDAFGDCELNPVRPGKP
jgi:hypothetical protein